MKNTVVATYLNLLFFKIYYYYFTYSFYILLTAPFPPVIPSHNPSPIPSPLLF